ENGLVKGECDYYIACNGNTCAVYHKDGKKFSNDFSIEDISAVKKINFNEILGIADLFDGSGNLIKSVDFIRLFKEEIIDYTKLLNI
ncbi:MAG: hypothetical protein ACP5OF_09685, partial [bacterium]